MGALVAAQDAPTRREEFGEGLTFDVLGAGEAEERSTPGRFFVLFRIGIEPGGFFRSGGSSVGHPPRCQ